jgi:hypothetical protein
MRTSIKKQQTINIQAVIVLISLLVAHATPLYSRVTREVPQGFRYAVQVGSYSGIRMWCVFTKDKNSYRMYDPFFEKRAVFVRSPIP